MKKLLFLLGPTILIGCQSNNSSKNNQHTSQATKKELPFGLHLAVEDLGEHTYNLNTLLRLDSGIYVISPYSKDDVYGPFTLSVNDSSHLSFIDSLIELPSSVPEFDSILEAPVRFIKQGTRFQQKMQITKPTIDFETTGSIWMVPEPSCLPYEMEFTLIYKNGQLNLVTKELEMVLGK